MNVSRRTLLGTAGALAVGTAGCTDSPVDADGGPTGTETARGLSENCPTSQDLGVEWPAELDAAAAESFLEAYENAYYREVVVDYESESRVDEYSLEAGVTDGPTAVEDGYEVALSGSGGVYRPTLHLSATTAEPPPAADTVPVGEVDDGRLRDLLETAAAEGEAEHHVEPPGRTVDRYIELVASLSGDFEPLEAPGDSGTAYFDVDGAGVELVVQADSFHGDYWWEARYYVDEHVVRRVDDAEGDPRENGDLLECREAA